MAKFLLTLVFFLSPCLADPIDSVFINSWGKINVYYSLSKQNDPGLVGYMIFKITTKDGKVDTLQTLSETTSDSKFYMRIRRFIKTLYFPVNDTTFTYRIIFN